ncbi:chalcone isomerase family protein [Shewanella rhizosphaerae]|uniref:chalcone isomerase family protein n=1 Tax=Shewanella rhizosphaerae TaxID=2864207 RepID=UPI001C658006|nr:chalcone isomerase family protein [Shewanella rhizosphaerae]QYK14337.1 chalcone isomerase family protein [Shewanella rhizosphaerae]
MGKYLLLLLLSLSAQAADLDRLHKIGSAEMQYLFWTLYRAELYSAQPDYEASADKALKINYYRDIESDQLIEATLEQWRHLGYSDQQITSWQRHIQGLWPNVREGDSLTLWVNSQGDSYFYFGDKPLGQIQDRTFGEAFLAIWLSERTSEPELRQGLLGLRQ